MDAAGVTLISIQDRDFASESELATGLGRTLQKASDGDSEQLLLPRGRLL